MKRLLTLILLTAFSHALVSAQVTRIVCDDTCKTESGATAVKGDGFAVVSPIGRGTVKMIEMAPRLNSLDGKPTKLLFYAIQHSARVRIPLRAQARMSLNATFFCRVLFSIPAS